MFSFKSRGGSKFAKATSYQRTFLSREAESLWPWLCCMCWLACRSGYRLHACIRTHGALSWLSKLWRRRRQLQCRWCLQPILNWNLASLSTHNPTPPQHCKCCWCCICMLTPVWRQATSLLMHRFQQTLRLTLITTSKKPHRFGWQWEVAVGNVSDIHIRHN